MIKMLEDGNMSKIREFCKRGKEFLLGQGITMLTVANIVTGMVMYALLVAYLPTQNGDNIEHIHASFLITLGQVPYRDFFQHHNPLLWYLFAPLTQLFAYNTTIVEIVCLISLLVFFKSLVYVYRIGAEFFINKQWALMAVAFLIVPGAKLYVVDFRPDNYMIFCLCGGLYYYFKYLQKGKTSYLCGGFAFFFMAFMFAQKALFPLAVLGLNALYFWYKKVIKTKDMLIALIFPFFGGVAFIWYLMYYDMVQLYFISNYIFNLNLAEGFELSKVVRIPLYMKAALCFGWIGAVMSVFSNNRFFKIISLLFVSEFVQRLFYFSPYSYYYWLLFYLAVLCSIIPLARFNAKNRMASVIVVMMLYFIMFRGIFIYSAMAARLNERMYLPDFITRQITPCDYVFNGDGMMYNLFAKDPAYYWQLIGQLDVIGEKTGIHPKPDINSLIEKYKPKFVYGKNYFNKFAGEEGKQKIVHYVDQRLIEKYYDKTDYYPVYRLKDKYAGHGCEQDVITHEWKYVK